MNRTKIHPVLQQALNMASRSASPTTFSMEEAEFPVIVRMRPTRSRDTLAALDSDEGGLRVERRINLLSALAGSATRAEIEVLSESDVVEMIWYDEPVYAMLDSSVPMLGVPSIWQGGNLGAGVRLCIVDTGLDASHPDFAGRVLAVQDFTGEGLHDGHGHGTHVASIAAGSGAASNGRYRGVAPEATLLSAKVLRGDGTGRMSFVMAGVEWAVSQGAQVINLSLGSRGACDGSDPNSLTCDAAVDAGAVVLVAAGNDGPGSRTVGSPGCARKVITVGAVADDDTIAGFSSRGPTLDGRVKPDIVLPGVSVVAARASGTMLGTPLDERYTNEQGTSMATPHASGVAALMLAANPNLTPPDVKRLMGSAVRSIGQDENTQGAGRLIATRAVELARAELPAPPPVPPTPTPPPSPNPPPPVTPPAPEPEGCLPAVVRKLGRR